ncbi:MULTISPECIES: hypothetical protein [unclassified Streptomyces]|uniref:DUF7144 family membrane protein n=1 Tax=unclassified Streptomyces TaxID=2593676 RepID=UPI003666E92B
MSSQESQQAMGNPSAGGPTGQTSGPTGTTRRAAPDGNSGWVSGGVVFAGVLMLCSGVLAAIQGIAAIAEDDVYARIGDYVFKMNLTGWGWLHLILGIIVAVVGGGLLSNQPWARVVGIVVASLSLIAQFLFLPYLPIWSVVVMAIDVFIIWALASYHVGNRAATA